MHQSHRFKRSQRLNGKMSQKISEATQGLIKLGSVPRGRVADLQSPIF